MMPFLRIIDNQLIVDRPPPPTVLFRYSDCPYPPNAPAAQPLPLNRAHPADSTGTRCPATKPFNLPLAMPDPTPPYLWALTSLA